MARPGRTLRWSGRTTAPARAGWPVVRSWPGQARGPAAPTRSGNACENKGPPMERRNRPAVDALSLRCAGILHFTSGSVVWSRMTRSVLNDGMWQPVQCMNGTHKTVGGRQVRRVISGRRFAIAPNQARCAAAPAQNGTVRANRTNGIRGPGLTDSSTPRRLRLRVAQGRLWSIHANGGCGGRVSWSAVGAMV
jgi:hypothetical protein